MNAIDILSMEYDILDIKTSYGSERIKRAIDVKFTIAGVECSLKILTKDVENMNEDRIKGYIYNYLNSSLERKFIDEI